MENKYKLYKLKLAATVASIFIYMLYDFITSVSEGSGGISMLGFSVEKNKGLLSYFSSSSWHLLTYLVIAGASKENAYKIYNWGWLAWIMLTISIIIPNALGLNVRTEIVLWIIADIAWLLLLLFSASVRMVFWLPLTLAYLCFALTITVAVLAFFDLVGGW